MKFLDEFRDPEAARRLADALHKTVTRPWRIMEVCGGQTHSIVKHGIDQLLPESITLVHGPGCPVCVTPVELIDRAIDIAQQPGVILCSFGDMMRVPGSDRDLLSVKAAGGDVRMVYSPMDAVQLAEEKSERQVVFFAVGFETTAPANAMAVHQAKLRGLTNFSMLVSQVLVPPAVESILQSEQHRINGFLLAGHVCTVMGFTEYEPIAERYRVPLVVTGFEPVDILHGLYLCVRQLESGRAEVENQYTRSVTRTGNRPAQELIQKVFHVVPRAWRGIGEIPASGLSLTPEYEAFDAERRFGVTPASVEQNGDCISGRILLGLDKPTDCPAFGARCTPEKPLGATMVSTEGACSAYYRYRHS
ncbi:Hydrogenase maturation protein HypD [Nitrospina gracilis 3/211]|uniref:Hydrogenase maturation protein HypD n=1 Tax=Nitrospina gracilis (strain 3/211) TaxID=1266370 RepID=M1YWC3_NITG3|nr:MULTISPECIES: hydrogenase formation protein HypD [Nitrospina]MCF8722981.1 hydrogenase expression/formation protein HypD [Nitrospina sp. Nb-3]CCQ89951.1 Hydrogenase maturation protein HypD [Nitrospina gracilis 3/211]